MNFEPFTIWQQEQKRKQEESRAARREEYKAKMHCRKGLCPFVNSESYLNAYANEYAKEQILSKGFN